MSDTNSKALPSGCIIKSPSRYYKILGVIGSGGFGITYKARVVDCYGNPSDSDSRFYAIKELFIAEYCSRNDDNTVGFETNAQKTVKNAEDDFVREATMLNRLGTHHPNIVFIHEVFKANNTSYYAMDFLEGETLQDYIKRCGPQPIKWAMKLIAPLFDALECMHANRMTHLDIKPANIIMVERDGKIEPVLIDFGLSKHYDEDGISTSFIHNIACSKGYAPLEQYAGLQTFTPQADVYALTATIYYCLTGAAPEMASDISPKTIGQALPAQLPEAARSAILRGMLKNKDHRTPSIGALRLDLQKYMPDGMPSRKPVVLQPEPVAEIVAATPVDEPEKRKKDTPRKPEKAHTPAKRKSTRKGGNRILLVAAVAVMILVAAGVILFSGSDSRRITEAIENSDEETLARYAALDSTRAIMAMAKLKLKNEEFFESAKYIHKLDSMDYQNPRLESIRKQVDSRAYENYYFYMSDNIPSANHDASEPAVEFAMDLRLEADSTRMLIGSQPDMEDPVLRRQRDRFYKRFIIKGNSMSYGSPEQIDAYRKALKFRENSDVRSFISQWE